MKQLNVRLLLTNASKNGRWVSYTFLQKLSSCKFYSILEENCGADIINRTFKCKTFVDKCCKKRSFEWFILSYKRQVLSKFSSFEKKIVVPTSIMEQLNVSFCWQMFQRTVVGWVILSYKNLSSFNFYSILEENCVADINNEAFECNIFADNCCKNRFWVSYTFLQKPLLFKQYWISSSFSRNFFLFENQRFWRNQYLKVLMASKCDENKNWLSKTQKKSNVSLENHFLPKC